jgi:hypothetical protein
MIEAPAPSPGSVRIELEVRVEDLEAFAKVLVAALMAAMAHKHG